MTFSPMEIAVVAAVLASVLNFMAVITITLMNRTYNQKNNAKQAVTEALKEKVNAKDCEPAMKRMGRQVDKIDKINGEQDNTIKNLEVGIAYLVGKSGGDYKQIKDTGINLR